MATSVETPAGSFSAWLKTHQSNLLTDWGLQIQQTPELRPREDLQDHSFTHALEDFFALILQQIRLPNDYRPFRNAISEGSLDAFTPDAACRLFLVLKRVILDQLSANSEEEEGVGDILDEILLRLAQFMHETRYQEIREEENERAQALSGTRRQLNSLLETMNEGFTALDNEEHITIFNQQMEQITGYDRDEVLDQSISKIYTPESLKIIRSELEKRRQGQSSSYEAHIAHKDGQSIPVRISGAPLYDNQSFHIGSFAVITDISIQAQVQETLQKRNQEIARLLSDERKRTAHFAIINQVAQLALTTLDPDEIFRRVVHAIQENFGYYHTSLFLVDKSANQMVLHARTGVYEPFFHEGYCQQMDQGIVGSVGTTGDPLLANDVSKEPHHIFAFPEEEATRAELCVPIKIGTQIIGVLDVQSQQHGIFGENDLAALQILADQLAWAIHNARLFQETRKLKEFNEQVLQTIPLPILLLDQDLQVVFANQRYLNYHNLTSEQIIGHALPEVRPSSHLVTEEGRQALQQAFKNPAPILLDRVSLQTEMYKNRVVNIRLSQQAATDGSPLVLVVIEDITESLEKAYESSLLHRLSQTMQGILDLDRLLYAALTCVTAGTALGFNRAILFLVNKTDGTLEGKMGVGPSSPEEATQIWRELASKNPTLDDILEEYDRRGSTQSPLDQVARQIRIPLDEPDDILARSIRERQTLKAVEEEALHISPALWAALGSRHFVVTPLVAHDQVVGAIVADNLYSSAPITDDSVDRLVAFASHVALALENAELYRRLEEKVQELERTQEELVQAERLSVIGEMSARIAHEIRNPMTTIGGFARSILKSSDPDRIQTAGRIIVEEVERLENLLNDTLDFTRPNPLHRSPIELEAILDDIRQMLKKDIQNQAISYTQHIHPDLPSLNLDAAQFKQVLLNLFQNALQAMAEGGTLTVSAQPLPEGVEIRIQDTGEGIAPEHLEEIFSPFFTTKTYGTGLGLPISKKIIEDHQGCILFESEPGKGTTVSIHLPSEGPAS
ncbi:MAG: PAS domain S-box protein [bacterium]|nr:PAS domain S-box protein [bacterium]